jgi:hypothetical protein
MTETPTTLTELGGFLDPVLRIPYRGEHYDVPAASAHDGLILNRLIAEGVNAATGKDIDPASIELVADKDEPGFYTMVLGPAYQQLIDAGATYQAIKNIGIVAMLWHTQGFAAAKEFWVSEGKAPAPNRAQRRTATRTRTAAGATTRKPGSANTTTTPKATGKAASGRKSSATGTPSKRTSKTPE